MTKKEPSLPIQTVMRAMDKKDHGFYHTLTDQQKKDYSAWMMLRYASSVQGAGAPMHIYLVNELVNLEFTSIYKHPELQWMLFAAAGSGKLQHHQYIKPPTSRKKKSKKAEFISEIYPELKSDEIDLLLSMNNVDELKQLAKNHGLSDKDIEDIFRK
jgi:hypothetical protein